MSEILIVGRLSSEQKQKVETLRKKAEESGHTISIRETQPEQQAESTETVDPTSDLNEFIDSFATSPDWNWPLYLPESPRFRNCHEIEQRIPREKKGRRR